MAKLFCRGFNMEGVKTRKSVMFKKKLMLSRSNNTNVMDIKCVVSEKSMIYPKHIFKRKNLFF